MKKIVMYFCCGILVGESIFAANADDIDTLSSDNRQSEMIRRRENILPAVDNSAVTMSDYSIGDRELLEYVGSALWTDIRDVVADNNYAYCAMANGLVVLDISDPVSPKQVGSLHCPGSAYELDKLGDLVFLADGSAGLCIIDVSNPAHPDILSICRTGFNQEVFVSGDLVYALSDSSYIGGPFSRLDIIDTDDPSKPLSIGEYGWPAWGIYDLFVDGTTAYICIEDSILILNIADPSHIVSMGVINVDRARELYVVDSMAYVAGFDCTLRVINVADPGHPTILGETQSPCLASDIHIKDSLAYITEAILPFWDNGYGSVKFYILNIADPTNPTMVYESESCGHYGSLYSGIFINNERLYHTGFSSICTYDLSDPVTPQQLGTYQTPGPVSGVRIEDGIAYVSCLKEFYILDVSNPGNPTTIARFDSAFVWKPEYENRCQNPEMLTEFVSISVDEDRLAISNLLGVIWIIDVSDPANPALAGDYQFSEDPYSIYTYDIVIEDDLMYVSGGDVFTIIDISDVSEPTVTGSTYSESLYALAVRDSLAYGIGPSGLGIFDISDSHQPFRIGVVGGSCTEHSADGGLIIRDTLAYASFCADLKILNISNPAAPFCMGRTSYLDGSLMTYADDIYLQDTLIYAAWGWLGTGIINVADPSHPYVSDRLPTAGWTLDIAGQGDFLYIADRSSLLVVKTTDTPTDIGDSIYSDILPRTFSLTQNHPNPFNPVTTIDLDLPRTSDVRLDILNIMGQKVTTLIDDRLPAGKHSIRWDGKDTAGNRVATGIYFYQIRVDDYSQTRKMLFLK